MRKYLSAAGALLLGILSVSCSEKGPSLEMEIDPMELSIAPEGGNQTFTVKSNKDWTLVADSWITPSTKGERGSEVTVTVNLVAGKNAEATARTGYVIISADGKKEKVVVTQEPFVAPAGIYNASDLADFANALKTDDPENIDLSKWTDADGTIKLYDDIDATALSCFPMEDLPAGTVLDGQKHTVTLSISATPDAKVGMFKVVSGTVRNLSLAGTLKVEGEFNVEAHIGALAGEAHGATIENCNNFVSVSVKQTGGKVVCIIPAGLVGKATQGLTMTKCTNNAEIKFESANAYHMAGGLVGAYGKDEFKIKMTDCKNVGTLTMISGDTANWNYVAGIISNIQGNITAAGDEGYGFEMKNCESSGDIDIKGVAKVRGGGVCGRINTYSHIDGCKFSGTISMNAAALERNVGGITSFQEKKVQALVENCTFAGRIEAEEGSTKACFVGGITSSGTAQTTVFNNCKTTGDSYVSISKAGNVSMILGQASNWCTFKDCKVAGTINKEGTVTVISADNYAPTMICANSDKVTIQNCGYNAE